VATFALFDAPLLQVAGLVFDAELEVDRGMDREYTQRRVGAGVTLSDHSRVKPREWSLAGAVSAIVQPQNAGRPGARGAQAAFAVTPSMSRLEDFEADLVALVRAGLEAEVVSKVVPRFRAVVLSWRSTTTPEDGNQSRYSLRLREVQRQGVTIALATPDILALTGSGVTVPGPSQTTPGLFSPVP
jgi:hypothetical protein